RRRPAKRSREVPAPPGIARQRPKGRMPQGPPAGPGGWDGLCAWLWSLAVSSSGGGAFLTRQAVDDRPPFFAFGIAFLALAEELDDHFAGGVIGLQRRDVAILRRLAHDPALADVIGAQMQVERRVQHVEPGTHLLDLLHRAGMDLDRTVVADEAHDVGLAFGGGAHDCVGGVLADLIGEILADAANGVLTGDLQLL